MKITRDQIEGLTLDELRGMMGLILQFNPNSAAFWDIMCAQRGPDSPSERPNMSSGESAMAYRGRRDRKFKTVEIIRSASFGGFTGGCARSHAGTKVTLPPQSQWDHFDKHVARAAGYLGLEVEIEKNNAKTK